MGTFQSDYLIAEIWDSKGKVESAADGFIKNIKNEQLRNLFHKFDELVNGVMVYFMCYDGSKEGWDFSEEADELRGKFVRVINDNTDGAYIYHIRPKGGIEERHKIFMRKQKTEDDVNIATGEGVKNG